MSSQKIHFKQKRNIHSSLTVPTVLYNLALVANGGDEKDLRATIRKLGIQANVLEVDNVSQFVQQQLLTASISQAIDVVSGAIEAPDMIKDTLAAFLVSIAPAAQGDQPCS